jgi:hypothetical protein
MLNTVENERPFALSHDIASSDSECLRTFFLPDFITQLLQLIEWEIPAFVARYQARHSNQLDIELLSEYLRCSGSPGAKMPCNTNDESIPAHIAPPSSRQILLDIDNTCPRPGRM